MKNLSLLRGRCVKRTLLGVVFAGCAPVAKAAPVTLNFLDMQWGVSEYAVAAQKIVDIDVFAPIAKTIAAQKGGTFPELNEVDGDAAFSTLIQQLWQGKPLNKIVPPAEARLEEIMRH